MDGAVGTGPRRTLEQPLCREHGVKSESADTRTGRWSSRGVWSSEWSVRNRFLGRPLEICAHYFKNPSGSKISSIIIGDPHNWWIGRQALDEGHVLLASVDVRAKRLGKVSAPGSLLLAIPTIKM